MMYRVMDMETIGMDGLFVLNVFNNRDHVKKLVKAKGLRNIKKQLSI